ncbi:MAG TPA: helix-turn-helix domain-containing protein [Albitalea sp.]|uniref:TetR/AcrR family transcriptional regulator n=1 Tax=Piscinibacter sp. TaxID=1903157 RepID=UPI002ED6C034
MIRRPLFTDEEILDRARSVFLERGYAARTKQIASAVGLTWGAIAMRFVDKRSLFQRAMAGPQPAGEDPARRTDGARDLPGLLVRLHSELWQRWPLRLQYRLATTVAGRDDALEALVHGLVADLEPHARKGMLRSDLGIEMLARLAFALLTGDVAQRFIARERSLPADPSLIDGAVRLVSAPRFQRMAGP